MLSSLLLKISIKNKYRLMYPLLMGFSSLSSYYNCKILSFHRLSKDPGCGGLEVYEILFNKLLKYLLLNYEIIGPNDIFIKNNNSKPRVLITFDDGYEDNYSILFPIIKEVRIPVIIFLTTGAIDQGFTDYDLLIWSLKNSDGRAFFSADTGIRINVFNPNETMSIIWNLVDQLKVISHEMRKKFISEVTVFYSPPPIPRVMLTWNQIMEMHTSGLITFGAHTVNHPILTRISKEEARQEIIKSKARVFEATGINPIYFAYPNGQPSDFDDSIINIVKEAGFVGAFTTVQKYVSHDDDLYKLPRIDISNLNLSNVNNEFDSKIYEVSTSMFWLEAVKIKERIFSNKL